MVSSYYAICEVLGLAFGAWLLTVSALGVGVQQSQRRPRRRRHRRRRSPIRRCCRARKAVARNDQRRRTGASFRFAAGDRRPEPGHAWRARQDPGDTFPIGTTTVTCTATDSLNRTGDLLIQCHGLEAAAAVEDALPGVRRQHYRGRSHVTARLAVASARHRRQADRRAGRGVPDGARPDAARAVIRRRPARSPCPIMASAARRLSTPGTAFSPR